MQLLRHILMYKNVVLFKMMVAFSNLFFFFSKQARWVKNSLVTMQRLVSRCKVSVMKICVCVCVSKSLRLCVIWPWIHVLLPGGLCFGPGSSLCFSQEKPEGEALKQTALELGKCARTSEDSAGPLFCFFPIYLCQSKRGWRGWCLSVFWWLMPFMPFNDIWRSRECCRKREKKKHEREKKKAQLGWGWFSFKRGRGGCCYWHSVYACVQFGLPFK